MSTMNDYWDALTRLSNNAPIRVPKNSSINNDTVALEAGRKRGSIKKSRATFAELIEAISEVSARAICSEKSVSDQLKSQKNAKNNYRELYHQALNRELMLVERVAQLEKQVASLKKVIPFKK